MKMDMKSILVSKFDIKCQTDEFSSMIFFLFEFHCNTKQFIEFDTTLHFVNRIIIKQKKAKQTDLIKCI